MSQFGQDEVVSKFYEGQKSLMFLDIGAYDGETNSNTNKLEKEHGWKGICVEPLEEVFSTLQKKRRALCVKRAIGNKSGIKQKFSHNFLHSGLSKHLHRNQVGKKTLKNSKQTDVVTLSLSDLLKQTFAPQFIHYFSLDTQGSELEILQSVDYKRYKFGIISVEHSYMEPIRTKCIKLLKEIGYLYMCRRGEDDMLIHPSMISGTYIYNNDEAKPITIKVSSASQPNKAPTTAIANSVYWPGMDIVGSFYGNQMVYDFGVLGKAQIYANRLDFGNGDIWHKKA